MEKFLEFINNASVSEIGTLLGVKPTVAKKVTTGRPFNNLETLSAISGLPLDTLNSISSNYDSTASPIPEDTSLTSSDSLVTTQANTETIQQQKEKERPHPGKGNLIVRIILWLLLLAAIAAGLYFGIPLFKKVILDPLQTNTAQVGELTTKQQQDVAALQQKIADLQNQVNTLDGRAGAAEETLAAYQATLAAQDKNLAGLTSALITARAEMNKMDNILATSVNEKAQLNRALQLLSRARLYLSQSNYGLAREDVNSARSLLFSLLDTISPEKEIGLRMAIERLDFALVNLPAYPVLAVYDLDIAWQLLVDDLPVAPELVITPAVFDTLTPYSPTLSAETSETPFAELTPTPQP